GLAEALDGEDVGHGSRRMVEDARESRKGEVRSRPYVYIYKYTYITIPIRAWSRRAEGRPESRRTRARSGDRISARERGRRSTDGQRTSGGGRGRAGARPPRADPGVARGGVARHLLPPRRRPLDRRAWRGAARERVPRAAPRSPLP